MTRTRSEASARTRKYADAAERLGWTFIQAFSGSFIVTGLDDVTLALKTAAVAGALSVAKSVTVWQIGNKETSSSLPENLDPATPPGQK